MSHYLLVQMAYWRLDLIEWLVYYYHTKIFLLSQEVMVLPNTVDNKVS